MPGAKVDREAALDRLHGKVAAVKRSEDRKNIGAIAIASAAGLLFKRLWQLLQRGRAGTTSLLVLTVTTLPVQVVVVLVLAAGSTTDTSASSRLVAVAL
jgi:hypothetical protein